MKIEQEFKYEQNLLSIELVDEIITLIERYLSLKKIDSPDLNISFKADSKTYSISKNEFTLMKHSIGLIDNITVYHEKIFVIANRDRLVCSISDDREISDFYFNEVNKILLKAKEIYSTRIQDNPNCTTENGTTKIVKKEFNDIILKEKTLIQIYSQFERFLNTQKKNSKLFYSITSHKGDKFEGESKSQFLALLSEIKEYVTSIYITSYDSVSLSYYTHFLGCSLNYEIKGGEEEIEELRIIVDGIFFNAEKIPKINRLINKMDNLFLIGVFASWGLLKFINFNNSNRYFAYVLLVLVFVNLSAFFLFLFNKNMFPTVELDFNNFSNNTKNYPKFNRKYSIKIIVFIITDIIIPVISGFLFL